MKHIRFAMLMTVLSLASAFVCSSVFEVLADVAMTFGGEFSRGHFIKWLNGPGWHLWLYLSVFSFLVGFLNLKIIKSVPL